MARRWRSALALGVDPARLVAGGGSAGGHGAVCAALFGRQLLSALVLLNPVLDTTATGWSADRVRGRELEISPAHHVRAGLPPTILFHGTADATVPFENTERFTRLMRAAGNVCELVAFPGRKHASFNKGVAGNADFPATLSAAETFLAGIVRSR